MKKYQFKTNINCANCVAKVTPLLNENPDIKSWNVDTAAPDKVLSVETEGLQGDDITAIVKKAGFKAEQLG